MKIVYMGTPDFSVGPLKALIEAGELGDLYHIYCSFRSHRSIPGLGGPFTMKEKKRNGQKHKAQYQYHPTFFYLPQCFFPLANKVS